jgi:hypothetical protein
MGGFSWPMAGQTFFDVRHRLSFIYVFWKTIDSLRNNNSFAWYYFCVPAGQFE